MPTYSYACKDCDHQFDIQQAFTDASLTQCPDCHGRLRKVYGSVGVVFKGSGFYRTDSRSSAAGAAKSEGGSSTKQGAGKDSATGGSGSGSKGSGGKESGSKESGAKEPAASGTPSSSTGSAKAAHGS